MSKRFTYICNICKFANMNKSNFIGLIKDVKVKMIQVDPDSSDFHICKDCVDALTKK